MLIDGRGNWEEEVLCLVGRDGSSIFMFGCLYLPDDVLMDRHCSRCDLVALRAFSLVFSRENLQTTLLLQRIGCTKYESSSKVHIHRTLFQLCMMDN